MKKNSIFKILLLFILGTFILSYIFPTAIDKSAQMQYMPIWSGLKYPLVVLEYFSTLPILILVIGALYGILNKTGYYHKVIGEITKKVTKNSVNFVVAMFILFATLSSITSMGLGLLIFVPLVISVIIGLKYDKIVAFVCTFGAILIGNISSIFNYNIIAGLIELYKLEVTDTIIIRIIILIFSLAISVFFLLAYLKKGFNKKEVNLDNSEIEIVVDSKSKNKKSTTPVYIIIGIMFLIILIGTFPWELILNINIFTEIATSMHKFELDSLTNLGSSLYNVKLDAYAPFISTFDLPIIGNYSDSDFIILILLSIVALKFTLKIKLDDIIEGFYDGIKTMIKPVTIVIIVHVILIIGTYHPSYMFFVQHLNNLLNGFNLFIVSIITVLMTVFNVDINMFVQNIVMILGTNIIDKDFNAILSITIQTIYGLVSVISPTSLLLALGLSYMNINYKTWLKYIWKTILAIFILVLVILIGWSLLIAMA